MNSCKSWTKRLTLTALALAISAAAGAPDPATHDFLLIASAESRGELAPCDCPQEPLGGLPRRATLLHQVRDSGHPFLAVELGEVFPPPEDMDDPEEWAAVLGTVYGRMGYGLVIFGEDDRKLGAEILNIFERAFNAENPGGKVAIPPQGGGSRWINFEDAIPNDSGPSLAVLVVWPPASTAAMQRFPEDGPGPADINLCIVHGNIIAAQKLLKDSTLFDHIVVGDGSKFEEVKRINATTVSGPGIRGRTLSFARFLNTGANEWGMAAYRLIPVSPIYEDDGWTAEVLTKLAFP